MNRFLAFDNENGRTKIRRRKMICAILKFGIFSVMRICAAYTPDGSKIPLIKA